MQLFPEFNQKMAAPHFDADAFTLVLFLGGSAFCKVTGSTNLGFRKATAKRPMYVQMDLQPNEGGFDRLEIHYTGEETVRMEFYPFTPIPGMSPIKGEVTVLENVTYPYMLEVFQKITGQNMQGAPSEDYY